MFKRRSFEFAAMALFAIALSLIPVFVVQASICTDGGCHAFGAGCPGGDICDHTNRCAGAPATSTCYCKQDSRKCVCCSN